MRELVYLSDRKLDQFLPELRSFWPMSKVAVRAPVVELAVEPMPDLRKYQLKHLTKVIAQVAKSRQRFTDPAIRPGQWVTFQAPLNYLVLDRDGADPMVFFVDIRTSSRNYPTGGSVRLVLHGSARHLRTVNEPDKIAVPVGENVFVQNNEGGSHPDALRADSITVLLNTLHAGHALAPEQPRPPTPAWARHLPTATGRLVRAIDHKVRPETAAWMAGHARVTACVPGKPADPVRYVLASPLYVENSTPPGPR